MQKREPPGEGKLPFLFRIEKRMQKGKKVRVKYTVPVVFRLQ